MHLKDYLDDLATRYTVRPLPAVTDVAGLETWQAQRRQDLFEQWGSPDGPNYWERLRSIGSPERWKPPITELNVCGSAPCQTWSSLQTCTSRRD